MDSNPFIHSAAVVDTLAMKRSSAQLRYISTAWHKTLKNSPGDLADRAAMREIEIPNIKFTIIEIGHAGMPA